MKRHGFTLVEIMVAMALTLFVMVILSQAFIAALDTFSGLKAIGDMDEGIRTTVNNLRGDLLMDHLADGTGSPMSVSKLTGTPAQGFFVIRQGSAPTATAPAAYLSPEATDSVDGLPSSRASDHVLHFSVNATQIHLPGGTIVSNRPENFFVAGLPAGSPLLTTKTDANYPAGNTPYRTGNTVSSPWAEVSYFLVAQGSTSAPNSGVTTTGGTPLYKLYRSQFLVMTPTDKTPLTSVVTTGTTGYDTVSSANSAGFLSFNTPTDLVAPAGRRFNPAAARSIWSSTSTYNVSDEVVYGGAFYVSLVAGNISNQPDTSPTQWMRTSATLLLNNVVSFAVRAMRPGDTDFVDIAAYDTNGATTSIAALEITIRVWDAKTQGTRQITIVQDM